MRVGVFAVTKQIKIGERISIVESFPVGVPSRAELRPLPGLLAFGEG